MRIVAIGGGGFSTDEDPVLDRLVLSLARRERPGICFVGTASGDSESYVTRFYRAFSRYDCRPSDLALFNRTVSDLRGFVLDQDVVYVGGGSTLNLLAIWRLHGLDAILREAWHEGVVLCGVSAGMNCWFEACTTDSFSVGRADPLHDGLGFLPGSACPHYDGEPARRPAFETLVASGELPKGYAADDGMALVFNGTELADVVTERPEAAAYRVTAGGSEQITRRRV